MGTYRNLQAPPAPAKGGTYRRLDQSTKPKRASIGEEILGGYNTLLRAIPLADEAKDAAVAWLKTAGDLATGDARPAIRAGKSVKQVTDKTYQDRLRLERAKSKASAESFRARHPVVGPLTEGVGNAITSVPAMLTGGAALAPGALTTAAPVAKQGMMAAIKAVTPKIVQASGKGGLVGALSAGLAGLAGEGDLDERIGDANAAIPVGAVLGAGLPALFAGGGKVANSVRSALAPAAQREAAQAGRILSARAPEAAMPPPRIAANNNLLPFERMGRGGLGLARAVAAVPGEGQDIAESVLRGRQAEAAERMLGMTQKSLGDDGSRFHVTLDALDKKRLVESQPLFEEAFGREAPNSRVLQDLSQRPDIRDAMKRAIRLARNEGEDPRALGLFHMEDPAGWASELPPTAQTLAKAEQVAARGGRSKAPQGKTLTKFIADGGGMRDDGGELAHMGADQWHKGKAFQAKLMGPGASADEWALRAWEKGYFPQFQERPTPNDLFDVLAAEQRGQPRYARDADPAHLDRIRMLDEAEEMAARGGFGDDGFDESAYTGRPEPQTGPVYGEIPTGKGWHYVKTGLDDIIEAKRDPVTGKLPRTEEMRVLDRLRYQLRTELSELNPTYGKALWSYAGPSKQMDAAQLGRKLVSGKYDPEDIATGMGKMSKDELEALRLGVARGLSDQFRGENPQRAIRRFANDQVVQDRLRTAFADRTAYTRFMRSVFDEAEAQQSFNRVLAGSRTTPLREDIDMANAAAESGAGRVVEVLARRVGGQSFLNQASVAGLRNWERLRQPGLNNPEVSRMLGEVLFESGDPAKLLDAMIAEKLITQAEVDAVMPFLAAYGGQATPRYAGRP